MSHNNRFSFTQGNDYAKNSTLIDIDRILRNNIDVNVSIEDKDKIYIKGNNAGLFTSAEALLGKYRLLKTNWNIPYNFLNKTFRWDMFLSSNNNQFSIYPDHYTSNDIINLLNHQMISQNDNTRLFYSRDKFSIITPNSNESLIVNHKTRKPFGIEKLQIQVASSSASTSHMSVSNNDLIVSGFVVNSAPEFEITKGLAGVNTISIKSGNKYIVENGISGIIKAEPLQNTQEFYNRASWFEDQGIIDDKTTSFESYNKPGNYIHNAGSNCVLNNVIDINRDWRTRVFLPQNIFKEFTKNNFINENKYNNNMILDINNKHFHISNNSNDKNTFEYTQDCNFDQTIDFLGITSGYITIRDTDNNIYNNIEVNVLLEKI